MGQWLWGELGISIDQSPGAVLASLLLLHSTEHSWSSHSPASHRTPKGLQRAQKGAQSVRIRDLGLCCTRFPLQEGLFGADGSF